MQRRHRECSHCNGYSWLRALQVINCRTYLDALPIRSYTAFSPTNGFGKIVPLNVNVLRKVDWSTNWNWSNTTSNRTTISLFIQLTYQTLTWMAALAAKAAFASSWLSFSMIAQENQPTTDSPSKSTNYWSNVIYKTTSAYSVLATLTLLTSDPIEQVSRSRQGQLVTREGRLIGARPSNRSRKTCKESTTAAHTPPQSMYARHSLTLTFIDIVLQAQSLLNWHHNSVCVVLILV